MGASIVFGTYKPTKREKFKMPTTGKYFDEAYWTDENDNPIKEALIGTTVKFHLKTKDIPDGRLVFMTLNDDDRRVNLQEDKENDIIELLSNGEKFTFVKIYNNKIELTLDLSNFEKHIKQDKDGILELYFACSYTSDHEDLPKNPSDYLKVKGMPKIIFVNGHWKTASRVPFGDNFGPTEPKKPYWVNGIASKANIYFQDFANKPKFEINNSEFSIDELEKRKYILYYDGSSDHAFDQSGKDRFNNGRKFAEENYTEIIQGLGNESIYLVSHSEGGAYASGIADYIHENGHTIGEHILLSPDEGDEFEIKAAIPSYQILYMFFSSIYNPILADIKAIKFKRWGNYYAIVDWIVNEHKIKGITKMGIVHYQDTGWDGVHGWSASTRVFDKISDLKEVQTFDTGEHEGEFYSGKDQSKVTNGTKFYRVNDDYIVTNCPPLIDIK